MSSPSRSARRRSASRKSAHNQPESLAVMTPKTRDFIQKICYKKTASVDMTRYGFITESRMGPINVYVKPLRDQIRKIVESNDGPEETSSVTRRRRTSPSAAGVPSKSSQRFSIDSLNKYMNTKLRKKSVVFSL